MLTRRVVLTALAGLPATPSLAHSYRRGAVSIGHAWGLPSEGTSTRVMIPLLNEGSRADRLVSATSAAAATITLFRGEAPADALVLAPGRPIAMRPEGLHLRLDGLSRPWKHGDRLPMRLTFEYAGTADIEVWIEPTPYAGPPSR